MNFYHTHYYARWTHKDTSIQMNSFWSLVPKGTIRLTNINPHIISLTCNLLNDNTWEVWMCVSCKPNFQLFHREERYQAEYVKIIKKANFKYAWKLFLPKAGYFLHIKWGTWLQNCKYVYFLLCATCQLQENWTNRNPSKFSFSWKFDWCSDFWCHFFILILCTKMFLNVQLNYNHS